MDRAWTRFSPMRPIYSSNTSLQAQALPTYIFVISQKKGKLLHEKKKSKINKFYSVIDFIKRIHWKVLDLSFFREK